MGEGLVEGLVLGVGIGVLLRQVILPAYVRLHRRQAAPDPGRHRGR